MVTKRKEEWLYLYQAKYTFSENYHWGQRRSSNNDKRVN